MICYGILGKKHIDFYCVQANVQSGCSTFKLQHIFDTQGNKTRDRCKEFKLRNLLRICRGQYWQIPDLSSLRKVKYSVQKCQWTVVANKRIFHQRHAISASEINKRKRFHALVHWKENHKINSKTKIRWISVVENSRMHRLHPNLCSFSRRNNIHMNIGQHHHVICIKAMEHSMGLLPPLELHWKCTDAGPHYWTEL